MNAQWIVSHGGELINLRQCVSIEWVDGAVWATEAHNRENGERRTHLLVEGTLAHCGPFLAMLAQRVNAVDSRNWSVPA